MILVSFYWQIYHLFWSLKNVIEVTFQTLQEDFAFIVLVYFISYKNSIVTLK